ncbi:MAG: response regulator [Nitrospirota bacterium]
MDLNKKRVLIVDDDSKSRRIFEINLNSMGYETVIINNGDEALEFLARDPYFDLIITDIMMPYLTGFEFARKLKEYTETKNIPVIATSAFHDWHKSIAEHELIVDGFIPKPVEREALLKEIKRVAGL